MAVADPKCPHCGRLKVFIGIAGGAQAICPQDCSACKVCKHPDAVLRLIQGITEHRANADVTTAWYGFMKKFFVCTFECTKCGDVTVTEKEVP